MTKLDKELLKIVTYSSDEGTSGYLITDEQLAQIKTVILEALKAEWPEELELIDGREQFTSAFNGCRYDCLEVCNKLLGDGK